MKTFIPLSLDKIPPYCEPYAMQAVHVARSYKKACDSNTVTFGYAEHGHTFLSGYPVFESNKAMIDCSTFIHLVLRGIRFEDSPYALDPPPTGNFDCSTLSTNTMFRWADDSIRSSHSVNTDLFDLDPQMVRYAADLAEYFVSAGRAFPYTAETLAMLKPGDLVFYFRIDLNRFMKIGHVGIVTENTEYIYNVISGESETPPPPVVSYSKVEQPDRRVIAFFARPDYTKTAAGSTGHSQPINNYLMAPWSLAVAGNDGNVSFVPDNHAGTIWTKTGTAPEAETYCVIRLADADHPIYLPKGVYKLTGAPAHPDRRSNYNYSYWGLRVYRSSGENIAYSTFGFNASPYSGDVSELTTSGPKVWDRGYGAIFTITGGSKINADIYIAAKPASDSAFYTNAVPTVDVWRPSLVRIADYENNDRNMSYEEYDRLNE